MGAGAAAMMMPQGLFADTGKERKPNVVLIMADDLGAESLSCYGSTSFRTPNLDALAKRGVRFENAYCTPLCTPSRAQLMTGQYPFRNSFNKGIWVMEREEQFFDPGQPNFANILKPEGYATAVAGKWQLARFDDHPDHPRDCGFDEYCLWAWIIGEEALPRYWSPGLWRKGRMVKEGPDAFAPDIYCDFIIDFIRRNRSRPFLAYYSMALPHLPFILPPGMGEDKEGVRESGERAQKNFKAMLEYADRLVGKIIKELDDLDLLKDTLVLFTGDNGTPDQIISELGDEKIQGGKFKLNEAGTRVPLIALWPGTVPGGRVTDELVDFTDLLPTFADLGGAKLPEGVRFDGQSILPLLKGEDFKSRQWIYAQHGSDWFIRDKRYRLRSNGKLHDMKSRYFPTPMVQKNITREAAAAGKRLKEQVDKLRGSS